MLALLLLPLCLSILPTALAAQGVIITGYLIDNYCWDLANHRSLDGVLLDERPDRHSVHCLRDVTPCIEGGYAIVQKNAENDLYHISYQLDVQGNADALAIIKTTPTVRGFKVTASGIDDGTGRLTSASVVEVAASVPDSLTIGSCGCEASGTMFCNFDDGDTGFCESCSSFEDATDCDDEGLPDAGAASCKEWCPPFGGSGGDDIEDNYDCNTVPVSVFGVKIFAAEGFGEEKLDHVANVMAKYLDNNEDGCVDDERVHAAMLRHNAAMVMSTTEDNINPFFEELVSCGDISVGDGLQDLYAVETRPDCSGTATSSSCRDAALEEVLHLISNYGYEEVYPDLYGHGDSILSRSMDLRRGGNFQEVPAQYPDDAIYFYDDMTCEYECQLTEYFYWALTSALGAQFESSEGVCWSYNEWLACTPEKMQELDPTAWDLLVGANQTALPSEIPSGSYSATYSCDNACCSSSGRASPTSPPSLFVLLAFVMHALRNM